MTKKQAKEGAALLKEVADALAVAEGDEAVQWIGLAVVVLAGAALDVAHTLNPEADITEDTNETTED